LDKTEVFLFEQIIACSNASLCHSHDAQRNVYLQNGATTEFVYASKNISFKVPLWNGTLLPKPTQNASVL